MPFNTKSNALMEVCKQLHSLADEFPFVGEAPLSIAGTLRNSVTLLEVLVLTKMST